MNTQSSIEIVGDPETKPKFQRTWSAPKPAPAAAAIPEGHTARKCGKCNGNGLYVMAVVNGEPWSATGTVCWSCGGRGWKIVRKPRRRPAQTDCASAA